MVAGAVKLSRYINHALSLIGLRVIRLAHESDYDSYMVTPRYAAMLREELCEIAGSFLTAHHLLSPPRRGQVQALVDEFFEIYPQRPVLRNTYGSGFDNCFWLFLAARCLAPELIVESGVQRGQTTWVLRQACPQAALRCFDINLGRRVYTDPQASYVEADWSGLEFGAVDAQRSLCFFDDHVNQARRVREAHQCGFRHLIFDDTVPAHKIYADAEPPLPTVHMLLDPRVQVGERIEWVCQGHRHSYVLSAGDSTARELIQHCAAFPDIAHVVGHGRSSHPAYVRLVE